MKGKSNFFYVADLILCGLALLFTCKYIGVYHRPFVFSLFMANIATRGNESEKVEVIIPIKDRNLLKEIARKFGWACML